MSWVILVSLTNSNPVLKIKAYNTFICFSETAHQFVELGLFKTAGLCWTGHSVPHILTFLVCLISLICIMYLAEKRTFDKYLKYSYESAIQFSANLNSLTLYSFFTAWKSWNLYGNEKRKSGKLPLTAVEGSTDRLEAGQILTNKFFC